MFGIGTTELIVILVVALIVLGPDKLPKVAKTMGRAMGEFKRMTSDVQTTIKKEMDRLEEEEVKPKAQAETKTAEAATAATNSEVSHSAPEKDAPKADVVAQTVVDAYPIVEEQLQDIPKPEAMLAAGVPGEPSPIAEASVKAEAVASVTAELKTDSTGGKA